MTAVRKTMMLLLALAPLLAVNAFDGVHEADSLTAEAVIEFKDDGIVDMPIIKTFAESPVYDNTEDTSIIEAYVELWADDSADSLIAGSRMESTAGHGETWTDNFALVTPKKVKYGRRVAYNNSSVPGLRVRVYSFDGGGVSYTEYGNKASYGSGFEISGIILVNVTESAALNFAPGLIIRKPLNTKFAGISEIAASLPMLLEWKPFRFPAYALFGVQPDAPLVTRVTWHNASGSEFSQRTFIDFGFVAGVGGYVNDRIAFDARVIAGLVRFDSESGRRLNQFNIGMSYIR